jgi:hypothetical protein
MITSTFPHLLSVENNFVGDNPDVRLLLKRLLREDYDSVPATDTIGQVLSTKAR